MQPSKTQEQALDKQLDEICDGFREAVDREVETLQREGLPIYVSDNGASSTFRNKKTRLNANLTPPYDLSPLPLQTA